MSRMHPQPVADALTVVTPVRPADGVSARAALEAAQARLDRVAEALAGPLPVEARLDVARTRSKRDKSGMLSPGARRQSFSGAQLGGGAGSRRSGRAGGALGGQYLDLPASRRRLMRVWTA